MEYLELNRAKIDEFLALSGVERSRLTDIPTETWSRWKKGTSDPGTKKLRQMAPKFGLTFIEMVVAFEELRESEVEARQHYQLAA